MPGRNALKTWLLFFFSVQKVLLYLEFNVLKIMSFTFETDHGLHCHLFSSQPWPRILFWTNWQRLRHLTRAGNICPQTLSNWQTTMTLVLSRKHHFYPEINIIFAWATGRPWRLFWNPFHIQTKLGGGGGIIHKRMVHNMRSVGYRQTVMRKFKPFTMWNLHNFHEEFSLFIGSTLQATSQ